MLRSSLVVDTGLGGGDGVRAGTKRNFLRRVGNIVEPAKVIEQRSQRWGVVLADRHHERLMAFTGLLDRAMLNLVILISSVNNAGLIRREDALEFSEKTGTMS